MSIRRKNIIMKQVGMKMLEEGKFLTKGEYDRCSNVPVRSAEILRQFHSWARMINLIRSNMPELVKEIEQSTPVVKKDRNDPMDALASLRAGKAV